MNVENVTKLVAHYEAKDAVYGWGYADCAAGALYNMRVLGPNDYTDERQVAAALGISQSETLSLVSGPPASWNLSNDWNAVAFRDLIVNSLKGLLETGKFAWLLPPQVDI